VVFVVAAVVCDDAATPLLTVRAAVTAARDALADAAGAAETGTGTAADAGAVGTGIGTGTAATAATAGTVNTASGACGSILRPRLRLLGLAWVRSDISLSPKGSSLSSSSHLSS
jgi:hypothetical protein